MPENPPVKNKFGFAGLFFFLKQNSSIFVICEKSEYTYHFLKCNQPVGCGRDTLSSGSQRGGSKQRIDFWRVAGVITRYWPCFSLRCFTGDQYLFRRTRSGWYRCKAWNHFALRGVVLLSSIGNTWSWSYFWRILLEASQTNLRIILQQWFFCWFDNFEFRTHIAFIRRSYFGSEEKHLSWSWIHSP